MQEPNKTPYNLDRTGDIYTIPALLLEGSVSAIRTAAESILDEVMPLLTGMSVAKEAADLHGDKNPATAKPFYSRGK